MCSARYHTSLFSQVHLDSARAEPHLTASPVVSPQLVMWLNQSFLLIEELAVPGDLNVTLTSLRTGRPLQLQMRQSGQVTVRTDDMELAGDIIQTLAAFLKVEDLQVRTREASMIRSWHTVKVLPVFFNHDVKSGHLSVPI